LGEKDNGREGFVLSGQGKEVFSNTRKSSSVRQFVFGLLPIICIEFIVVGVIIYIFVPKGWPLLLAFALLFSLYLYAAIIFTFMIRSAHILSADELYLRMASWFKCRLPISLIAAVEQYPPSSYPKPDMIGVMLAREGETLYCLSRKSDVCRIQLTEPVMVKAPAAEDRKSKRGLVREILINVDDPERFMQRMSGLAAVKGDLYTNGSTESNVRVAAESIEEVVLPVAQTSGRGHFFGRDEAALPVAHTGVDTTEDTVGGVAGAGEGAGAILADSPGIRSCATVSVEHAGAGLEAEVGGAASVGDVSAAERAHPKGAICSETQITGLLPSLEFDKLTRYFGDFPAVQNLTLKTYPGEIFGFLGANGAGKTTTIRMVTGLLKPTSGKVMVRGEDLWQPGTETRRLIGYVPDTPLVYERLTAREHLMVAGRLYALPQELIRERTEELLSILGLEKWGDQMISTYSMGMKRKISLALALLTDPELIIVDELTNAFDAPTLAQIKDILIDLRNREKTVFMSTHVMDVAEKVCDRVGIIQQGQLKALGTVDELCSSFHVEGGLEPLFLKLAAGKGVGQ
jgi:ABC-type multidrug transport system ATPase subunit